MEGRWAVLVTRAARQGALDYSKITRDDPGTLRKERLIIDDLEREITGDYFEMLAVSEWDRNKRNELVKDWLQVEMPWEIPVPERKRDTMLNVWERHKQRMENQKKKRGAK